MTIAAPGAQYYVATNGNDLNPGNVVQPWRTIQKAANIVQAGDTVLVLSGDYNERVTVVRGGTNESNRITFEAVGQVTMKGWVINQAFITIRGFYVSQWSGPSNAEASVKFGSGADYAIVEDCLVRGDLQLTSSNIIFRAEGNMITSDRGGFYAAGFAPGQTLYVDAAARPLSIDPANFGAHTIIEVTDTSITVLRNLVNQGPLPIYLSANFAYGVHFDTKTKGCLVRNNTFSNIGFVSLFIAGSGHRFSNNIVERCNGWDLIKYSGTNHVFERNWFRDSPLAVYQVSPDFSENWPIRYENILFTNNFVENVSATLSSQKYNTLGSSQLIYTRNIFIGLGPFIGVFPNTIFENNTFLSVASQNTPVVSLFRHPLNFSTANYATNASIRNNIFVACGQRTYPYTEAEMGWYQITGPTDSIVFEGNFVAGAPPSYGAKIGWPEGKPELNGGDPGFVNIYDPLGPDGIPFTDDDGLRPLPTSKLVGAGANGLTIGAYSLPGGGRPVLAARRISDDLLRLQWPQTVETWLLQSKPTLFGEWSNSPLPQVVENGQIYVTVGSSNSAAFFRLAR